MAKIFVSDPLDESAVNELKKMAEVTLENDWDFDIVIVRSKTKVTREFIDNAKNLKLVIRAGVGLDNVDQEYCKEKGIKVMNTPGASSVSVAELAMALMLACAREIVRATVTTKNGEWLKKQLKGFELAGKTLGLIGYGRIAHEVAKRARAFEMSVIVNDIRPVPDATCVDLDTLLAQADIISLHVPSTEQTKNMINKDTIAKMKDGVVIINTSRGSVINEQDLAEALKSGKVKYAGLDVYNTEPPENSPLLELDNVVLTPHIGANTTDAMAKIGVEVVKIVKDFLGA